MYLVELRPGKEELYRSVDELAAAIRRGDVDAHSRIFHRATSKWISITLHPQFKAIAAARESEPLTPHPSKEWTFLTSAADGLDGAHQDVPRPVSGSAAGAPPVVPVADVSAAPVVPKLVEDTSGERSSGSWRRPAMFGLTGLLLFAGVQLAFSVPRPQWPGFGVRALVPGGGARSTGAADSGPGSSVVSLASTAEWGQVGYPVPRGEARGAASPAHAAVRLPRAPQVQLPAFESATLPGRDGGDVDEITADVMVARYDAAYGDALDLLGRQLRVAGLDRIAAAGRLAPAASLGQARMSLAGARNFTRAYYARAVQIERSQQDTFVVLSKRHAWPSKQVLRWYGRRSHKESADAAARADALLESIDAALGVLARNVDAYDASGDVLAFTNREIAAEYGDLRRQAERQLEAARAADARGAMAAVLDAIEGLRLPVETTM